MRCIYALAILTATGWVHALEWTHEDYGRIAVVAPETPTDVEQKAVDLFVTYWERCTGHRPVVSTVAADGPAAWIGSAVPEAWRASMRADAMGPDAVAMQFHSKGATVHLALLGETGKGTLYAAYEFFERYLGVRWWAPGIQTIPEAPTAIVDVDYAYAPPFPYRVTALPPGSDGDDYRMNSPFIYGTWGHSLYDLLPPEEHFAAHPEWYSEVRGKRVAPIGIDWHMADVAAVHHARLGQLCMTNPDVAKALADAIEGKMASNPNANVWSVSQMDWGNPCECATCSALVKAEGTHAAPFLVGVNRVAASLEQTHPQVKIQTYAYTWTRKPPKTIRPHKNVIIQLCTFECDFARPLTDPESVVNRLFMRDFDGWQALGANLLIYDYPVNCRNALRPSPTEGVLGPNMRVFAERETLGVFEQGRAGVGAAFGYLKPYLIAKLQWNPSLDVDTICREFLDGYYGKAAPHLFEYMRLARETLREQGVQMFLFDGCGWITREFIDQAEGLFQNALNAAETQEIRKRVELAHVQVLYGAMLARPEPEFVEDAVIVRRPKRVSPESVVARLGELGLVEERDGWPSGFEGMREDSSDAPDEQRLPLVTLENEIHRLWIVPDHQGSVLRWQDKVRQRELLTGYRSFGALAGTWQDWEDRNTLGEQAAADAYAVTERTPRSVTLEAKTDQGLTIRRTMQFGDDPEVLEVALTMSNTGEAPLPAKVKIHPEFYCQRENTVPQIWVRKASGWAQLNHGADPLETVRGEFVIPETATAWAFFVAEEGYGLLNEFRKEELSRTLYFYNTGPGSSQINLELLPRDEPIAPGESRTVHASYRVITATPGGEW